MSLTLLYPVRLSPLFGRIGVGLLGLLEPVDPVPVVAIAVGHVDNATAEGQAVRVAAVPREST